VSADPLKVLCSHRHKADTVVEPLMVHVILTVTSIPTTASASDSLTIRRACNWLSSFVFVFVAYFFSAPF
jgi:hypothetical protein